MPTVKEGGKIVPKSRSAFTHEETKKVAKNYRAFNILFCGLDSNEFNYVFAWAIAKEVWDTLDIKGQVKLKTPKSISTSSNMSSSRCYQENPSRTYICALLR